MMEHDFQICPVAVPASDTHIFPLVQRIDQGLLDSLILLHIQRVDLHRRPEDFLKSFSNIRDGVSYDRKAV